MASWEIFYYNVLQDNGGPELYGTEPATFYGKHPTRHCPARIPCGVSERLLVVAAVNLALNFNGAFVLAAALPAVL